MDPTINVKRLFGVPNRPWPVVNRGSVINRVQKILQPNHVTGIPSHWPKIYYGQTRSNLAQNRTYRNTSVTSLPDGAYLYLIEYNPVTNRYHKSFVRVLNKLESGSRHFQLPANNQNRVIVAAGELSKKGSQVLFNLESGTYTRNLVTKTREYMSSNNYISLVKNALRNSKPEYTFEILVPQIPANLRNLLARGTCSFYHGEPTNKTRQKIQANLKKAGLTTNSAQNLIRNLAKKTCGGVRSTPTRGPEKSGPPRPKRSPVKRPRNNNGRTTQVPLRRSARTAGRAA
jgi:hypothetical protein